VAYVTVFLAGTNLLSRDQYGEAQQLLSLVALGAAIADLGISGSLRTFIGRLAVQDPASTRRFLLNTFAASTSIAVLAAALVVGLRHLLAQWFDSPLLAELAWLAAPLLVLTVLNLQLNATLDGLERFGVQALAAVFYSALLGGGVVIALSADPVAASLVRAYSVAMAVIALVGVALIAWATRGQGEPSRGVELPSSLRYGAWVFMATLFGLVASRMNVLIVGLFHSNDEVALYSVADRFFQIPILGLFLFVGVLAPRATRLYAAGDREGLQRLYQVCNGLAALAFGGVVLTLLLICTPMIEHLFPKYPDAIPLIRWLLPVGLFRAFGGIAMGGLLIATGHARQAAVLSLAATALNMIGDVIFVPQYGAVGAVYVTVAVQSATAVGGVVLATKLLKLKFRLSSRGWRSVLFG
jgi:O-antigen/teichoic acid export membrane protein